MNFVNHSQKLRAVHTINQDAFLRLTTNFLFWKILYGLNLKFCEIILTNFLNLNFEKFFCFNEFF